MMRPRSFSAAEQEDILPPLPSVASREICCVAWWVERKSTFPCIFFGLDSREDGRWRDELVTINALTHDLHSIGFPAIYFLSLDLSEDDKPALEEQYEVVFEFTIAKCTPELLLLLQAEFCDIGFSKRGQPGAFFLATTPQKVVYSWAAAPSSSGALACVAGRQLLRLPPSLSSVIKSLADELKDGEERIIKATPAAQPVTIFSVFNQRFASCVGWARRVSSSRASFSSSAEEDHEALATVSFMPLSSTFSTTTTSSLHS
jgi:hypothetical protein